MRATAAHDPLNLIRRLYDAWNAGDVATAAEVLSPDVRWDSFGGARAAGPNAMQATLAGGSGGTWKLTAVAIDLLVGVVDHVLAFSRRSGAEPERIEVWTLRDGKAVHYRGYPLGEGLAVLSETTRSRKLEVACRTLLAFNRGERSGDARVFSEQLPGLRIDDVEVLGETFESLVVSALHTHDEGAGEAVNLVITFASDKAWRVVAHPTAEAAVAAAARWTPA
ncbi:MAG: nuclear transport factor 2 family protein [Actinomycetota bacterium]|nr:nuclear transport factor 2 family protein [Actinomycetota bacterium]